MLGLGLLQCSCAQPDRQFGVFSFPGQGEGGEGPWPPQCLVVQQQLVECLETIQQLGALERNGAILGR